jgi:hypothetical protein
VRHFFVFAPNLTIYNKLIADFTRNTPKHVFQGVAAFAIDAPQIITGENYDATLLDELVPCRVSVFNISKINSEVRGGWSPRIKRLSEYLGESYFEPAAEACCRSATDHAATERAKSWRYAVVPHDVVTDNMTLDFLARPDSGRAQ